MKISEVIDALRVMQKSVGDVELYCEVNDGRSTSAVRVRPALAFREIWKGHSAGKKHFLRLC